MTASPSAFDAHDQEVVINYLHHLSNSIQILKSTSTSTSKSTSSSSSAPKTSIYKHTNVERYLDTISRDLLHVCNPSLLSLSLPLPLASSSASLSNHVFDIASFSPSSSSDHDTDGTSTTNTNATTKTVIHKNSSNHNNDVTSTNAKLYSRRDILRNIFYNMAPIAFDISTRIASIVIQSIPESSVSASRASTTTNRCVSTEMALQSFILFSYWIEYAPQISPIVNDLFQLSSFQCPFDHTLSIIEIEVDENRDGSGNDDKDKDRMDVDVDVDMDMDTETCNDNQNMDMEIDENDNVMHKNTNTKSNTKTNQNYIMIPKKEMTIISEAIYRIVIFYSNNDEHASLNSWWEWTKLYTLLAYQYSYSYSYTNIVDGGGGGTSDNDDADVDADAEPSTPKTPHLDDDDQTMINPNHDDNNNEKDEVSTSTSESISIPNYGYATMSVSNNESNNYNHQLASKWFIGRSISHLLNLTPTSKGIYLHRLGIECEFVPWLTHPWIIFDEKERIQELQLRKLMSFIYVRSIGGGSDGNTDGNDSKMEDENYTANKGLIIDAPSPLQIRNMVSLHPSLVHLGNGIVLPRRDTIASSGNQHQDDSNVSSISTTKGSEQKRQGLIFTPTTSRNLELLGTAMCSDPYPPPILVCGPRGSGKSSLIRELAHLCCSISTSTSTSTSKNQQNDDNLLELHVDEETDSKTLLGSYAATDIPGEFIWRPGALTTAVRKGKWVLLEDVECCPIEIQAALVKLFEDRVLPLGVGKNEKCHPNFRMFGTCTTSTFGVADGVADGNRIRRSVTTAGSGGKRLLHPGLWRKIHVDPLPYSELTILSQKLYPLLPGAVSSAVLKVFRMLDKSGRMEMNTQSDSKELESKDEDIEQNENDTTTLETAHNGPFSGGSGGRHSSVRDLVKLLGRISSTVRFEPGVTYCTESQRILCMAECFDVFVGWNPCRIQRREFAINNLAPAWGISPTIATTYIENRQPPVKLTRDLLEVGRCTIHCSRRSSTCAVTDSNSKFADTNYALRLMEAAGISISLNESTLLVGETGCGKTTLLQRLATLSGYELIVQNLSLQTDSTDLLGGYRPLEIRHIARKVYTDFVDLFVSSFSKSQNSQFLDYVTSAYEKGQWKRLSQCFQRAAKMGLDKVKQKKSKNTQRDQWMEFKSMSERFEKQRVACDTGLAFSFTEGALVDAIRNGKWVLLDEINLASSETLQRLCGLLDDSRGSVTLTEKGDSEALYRHPDFRLFAAMNPATDTGKKDLPSSLRARFTELYVDELLDRIELRSVAARYVSGAITSSEASIENSESVIMAVDIYLKCRQLSEQQLVDGTGQRPRYTLRTMCRALSAARCLIVQQKFSVKRALFEGYELGFEGCLDLASRQALKRLLSSNLGSGISKKELEYPGRRPGGRSGSDDYVLVKPFWLKAGLLEKVDFAEASRGIHSRFVLTPSMLINLRRLSRAIACGPWPVLLEGPTSAGKTTLVEYLAARCGHQCVRINNHEHTDVQEYTGSYASDPNGKLCFREGILVQALRKGYWVILDELNLAPSEVLEALNRLLDDNRELYLPEINEVVKPHPNFRLFATQNPSGAYGGRKPLSRAFRNRFVEIHVGEIPEQEMITILEKKCKCPPSHAKLLVKVMSALRKRRSKSSVFRGKDGLITPRDLLRWAQRKVKSKNELAMEGYMLLAERLRDEEEKSVVKKVIEDILKVDINCEQIYFGPDSRSRMQIEKIAREKIAQTAGLSLQEIAPTKSLLRLLTLVERCVQQKEPVLLVGDTGCGKTTVVQLMSVFLNRELQIVNCHASTETSDLLGGLRPLRGRRLIMNKLVAESFEISNLVTILPELQYVDVPEFLKDQTKKDDENGIPNDATQRIMIFVKKLRSELLKITKAEKNGKELTSSQCEKKRKLANGGSQRIPPIPSDKHDELLSRLSRIEGLHQQYVSLFEWVDGPLVSAMKAGHLFLLDEMSLAEDAVLERLNSVLEPSRTLTLAEKGGDDESGKSSVVQANDEFRVFATMNPGGDFGKRELSPALRSRFTEIWVPAVTDCGDIDLVLQQALSSSLIKTTIEESLIFDIKTHMLAYVNWFNNDICGKPMSTCADFVLSLRDVLAWARFIIDTNKSAVNLGLWAAYVHGASLMHLDGLGLGTGLTHDDASTTKNQAKGFLREQVPHQLREKNLLGFDNELDGIDESLLHRNNNFGIDPFVICTGPESIPCGSDFKMSAPTTALNLRRVLRAMQISKPILLEGSPGVGKTSLISALASMSGHTLVRINLSEQTDITDLMGSDLPVPDEGDGQASGASFRWCDGALLRAIKNGHWVLLDELNLASQSVLEGLNSCLDHRASVYVPELGQTFKCPPSFRIFAAQNPLAQGGGRKGLPKSFLNRFTKVYVEALTKDDLRGIVSTKFSMIPSTMVEHIVQFNCAVQQDIDQRKYGQLGSPWEFNLRDVFRWCELISYYHQETGQVDCEKFADTIYIQRLRSEEDRHLLKQRYKECFGDIACFTKTPNFDVYDGYIQVGNARVQKSAEILSPTKDILIGQEPAHLRSLARPMEAVAFCVQMTWPCLLVGPPACGKSTVLKTLAEACNVKLEEVVLTPSSDVNELIGCFEQIDAAEVENRLLLSLRALANYASITLISDGDKLSYLQKINTLHFHLHEKVNKMRKRLGIPIVFGQGDLLTIAKELVDTAVQASNHFDRYSKLCKDSIRFAIEDIRSFEKANTSHNSTVHFRWVDGILVTALEKGYWLNLENVNFCPSSVLDRLNPLMETDGVLVLTECGIQEDANNNGTSRVVKPHPNFRLFLSTNPAFGEVSRAMRNRCIEVSILSPAVPQLGKISDEIIYPHSTTETVDMLDLIVKAGLASPTISKFMLHSHAKEFGGEEMINEGAETSRSIKEWAMLVADASRRGFIGDSALKVAGQIAYGLLDSNTSPNQGVSCEYDQLVNRTQIRSSFSGSRIESIVSNDARLVKIMETCKRIPLGLSCFGKNGFDDNGQLSLLDKYAPALSYADSRLAEVRNHLTASFVRRSTVDDAMARSHFLVGYFGPAQKAVHHMITKYFSARTKKEGMFSLLQSDRLSVIYSEYQLYYDLKQRNQDDLEFNGLSVMQLSFCVYENKVDRSHINCPVIPIIYPLFIAIDTFLDMLESTIEFDQDLSSYSESLRGFLSSRDRLWMFLKEARVLSNSSFLAFDETGFLVHWNWVKKSLFALEDATNCSIYSEIKVVKRQLDLIMSSIDRKLFISNGDLRSMSNSFWKFVGHPLVPANADDWTSIDSLRQNDIALSPICEEKFSFINVASGISKGLTLEDLINCKHPSLSATSEIKMEVLSALCMAHWTTTDEMSSSIRKEKKNYDISNVTSLLINKIQSSKEEMSRKLHIHAVDSSVHLDVNKLDLHELEKLKEACSGNFEDGGIDLVKNLLLKFGKIQLMQTVEFWCVKEEKWIIESLAAAMISNNTGIVQQTQKTILPRMKAYIDVVANETVWPISDLRPLQSIVWFMESNHTSIESFRHLFRSTYSTLLVNSARHHWRNTFNDLQCISDTLVSPPFWNSGQSQQNEQSLVSHMHGCDMGSARLHHNVISACLFRLLGLNRDMIYSSQKHPYLTLENFDVRQMQSRRLTQFLCKDLSVLNESSSSFNVLLFFTENIINSLHDSFDSDSNVQQLQSYILGRGIISHNDVDVIIQNCKDKRFKTLAPFILKPLASALQEAKTDNSEEAIALASVYIGILSFHLLIPSSPLDPGMKPAAKVAEWNSYLQTLSSRLVAIRMESGLSTGNFYPSTQNATALLEEATFATNKQSRQEKKRVTRPPDVLPFHQLFREVQHFSKTIANVQNILGLLNSFSEEENNQTHTASIAKEINWQSSASAFFNKVASNYTSYEDVTSPFLAALGMMQNGIRSYVQCKYTANESTKLLVLDIQDNLLQYPNISFNDRIDNKNISHISDAFDSHDMIDSHEVQIQKLGKRCKFSYLMASLSHLVLLKTANIPKEDDWIKLSSLLFGSMARAWDLAGEQSMDEEPGREESEEERNEREYRDHFPDHRKDFTKIIEATEVAASGQYEDVSEDEEESNDDIIVDNVSISDQESNLLAELHFAMYSQKGAALNDSSRIQAFVQMYTAGALINHVTARSHVMQSECNRFNAHCFALSLNSMNENGIPFSTALMTSSDQNALDFHRDPNPIEVLKAYRPLKDLLHRISQLLRAFPGNSILIAIGQVAEMMLQLDINKVSLGKMLTGLEVVLRKAQDWEQHASHRVALGEKLSHISKLVAQWRKLELQSWSYLLDMRDKHYIVRSRRHWMRMYLLLMTEKIGDSDSSMINKNNESCFPSWVWKGVASKVNNLSSPNKDIVNEEDIMEIIKALDTFILTSGIGHFNERLRLIEAFANQLKEECKLSSKPSRRIKATILTSLHEHYSKFIPIIAAEKERLRKPIEKRLKGDVKLAKWDEQSYYALAESAEKSHMKLMMIVREYDEVLQTSVGKILENNFLRGIRSHGEVTKGTPTVEPVTEIPPSVSIFPALQDEKDIGKDKNHYSVLSDNVEHLREADRIWTPIEESSSSPYISGMQRYFKKMNQMFTEKSVKPDTHASKGGETTNLACETIFDRIESLRGKGTKPMKQRALVDLIKYLRKQGYSSMKWSVPKEIRQMNSLLQLPSPTLTGLNGPHAKALEESENYFRRSTIELSRLRSEVAMLGSAYMSKREMDLMTGFGEHGLLMLCQQRSAITSTISKLQSINDLINAFDKIHSSLPNNQLSLLESTENFDRTYTSLLEALQQSFLAIKKIALLNKEEGGSYRDTLGILEGCCSLLKQSYQPRFNDLFITKERLETVARVVIDLEKVQSDINICSMQSRGSSCLPSHFFDPCIKQLKKCFGYAGDIKQIESEIVLEDDNGKCMTKVNSLLSEIVKSSLLVAQNLQKGSFEKMDKDDMMDKEDDSVKMDDEETIWASHSNVLNEWNMIYLDKFKNLLLDLREQFVMNNVPEDNKALYQLSVDANCLVLKVIDVCKDRLADFISFFRNTSKFEYVKLRLFRILVSKGFCADDVEEGGDGEGDGGNMNFEDDVEGTGMGEGDGKNDVTDQIEDEEQLLGLKGDEDKEKQSNDKNELDEEEADTGMEMENEFDGELFDVPDKQEDENGEDDDEEEELDREMGDGEDPNEQVVDEKMWDEDDDDEDGEEQQKEEEKFEKDSKMSGEALQDELRTKEDDEEEGGKGKEDGEKPEDSGEQKHDEEIPKEDTDEGQDQDQPGKEEEDEIVNDDFEDNYEDKHAGIDVRNEEEDGNDADGPEEDEEEAMDLNDDLNLDDGEEGEDANNEDANNDENEEREGDEDDPEDDGEGGEGEHIDEDMEDEDDEEMDADGVQNAHQTLGEDDQMNADDNQEDKPEENEEEDDQAIDNTNAQEEQQPEAHGVAAKSGADTIKRVEDDEEEDGDNDDAGGEDNDDEENGGEGDNNESNPGAGGQTNDSSGDFQSGQEESSQTKTPKSTAMDAPNPFRDPGDAEKFWHKKLDMITENEDSNADANDNEEEKEEDATGGDEKDTDGTFEFTSQNQDNTTQVLGGVNEEDAPQLDQEEEKAEDAQDDIDMDMGDEKEKDEDESQQPPPSSKRDDKKKLQKQSNSEEDKTAPSAMDNQNNKEGDETEDINMDDVDSDNDSNGHDNNDDNNEDKDNKVVTDLSQLQVNEGEDSQNPTTDNNIIEYENHTTGTISLMEAEESRKKWSKLNAETNNLSRRLCEKLRLVLEPLVASKLRGDYRTGKRINMKRVIGYIASGYRKDKIWLRRTKPGKRDYRVLLAVDNSESMKSNGGGEVALMALATLATGMSQLEIGQLGVASFGEEMKLLHPFHAPFTSSSGADLVSNFTFDDKRTRTALCVESAIAALESQSENSSSSSSMQLVFMISDGRIERDSRDDLRRLVREMTERSILLVMIIVEGDNRKGSMKNKDKDSIVNMKEVSFVNGKPKVKYFIEDYPFPYYMVLQDMNTLPEVLGDALKQWFEMMSQNNS